ncbi:MAG: glycosyltransferase [Rhodospirillaceae bacterium]
MAQVSYSSVAVLIPCHNEEAAIAAVVADFRAALPGAAIYVYDNNSTDRTVEIAREAGAVVRAEPLQGKGNVVRRMFADVEAEVYVLVDGDATYDAASAPAMIEMLRAGPLDMVNAARRETAQEAYRPGHRFGNRLLTGLVSTLFGRQVADILSGYRAFSRRFVKSFPAEAKGFEIETEITVHALQMRLPMGEVEAPYAARPEGSESKLNTYRDGARILKTILDLLREERPLWFFGAISGVLLLLALCFGLPVVWEFMETGLVPRLPSAVLAASLSTLAALSFVCGLVLDTVTRGRREAKRLAYLSIPAPHHKRQAP